MNSSSSSSSPLLNRLNNYGKKGLNRCIRGYDVGNLIKGYTSLIDLLPSSSDPALYESNQSSDNALHPLTHKRLKQFIENEFDLTKFGIIPNARVAIIMSNGSELAVTLLCIMSRWCAAPISNLNTTNEMVKELISMKCIAMIIMTTGTNGAMVNNECALEAADQLGLGVIAIQAMKGSIIAGLFEYKLIKKVEMKSNRHVKTVLTNANGFITYDHPEIVLLLHTSGTSGNKKIVPYTLDMLIIGAGCIISSWNLTPADVCLNMMPLFHIGGIVRNLLCPILSGGSVILCGGFDSVLFWDILDQVNYSKHLPSFTWYYSSPSMHHTILLDSEYRSKPLPVQSIRFIANAAGALLPALAKQLKDTFHQATILTSYGMTECMPISSPPQDYALHPEGTSGIPVGVDVMIVDDDMKPLCMSSSLPENASGAGMMGKIIVRGPPCFGGYEDNEEVSKESFYTINGQSGWFNTGDIGYLDKQGYLFLSGRSKEIINRGGETISPFEIEEAIVQHDRVNKVMAFATPHMMLQEVVGVVVVTKKHSPRIDLASLHEYLDFKLHQTKWPQVIVFSDDLPKNNAGKILRLKFAERSHLPSITDNEYLSSSSRIIYHDDLLQLSSVPTIPYLYEMTCPATNASLTTEIQLIPITLNLQAIFVFLHQYIVRTISNFTLQDILIAQFDVSDKSNACIVFIIVRNSFAIEEESVQSLLLKALQASQSSLDAYQCPHALQSILEADLPSAGRRNMVLIDHLSALYERRQNIISPRTEYESQLESIWRTFLDIKSLISVTQSFFNLGGNSMKAGQLVNKIRKEMQVNLFIQDLFNNPTIEGLALKLSSQMKGNKENLSSLKSQTNISSENFSRDDKHTDWDNNSLGSDDSHYSDYQVPSSSLSSTSAVSLLIQSLPLIVFRPIKTFFSWFLFFSVWINLLTNLNISRLHSLVLAIIITGMINSILMPVFAILLKWIIIGKYKSGRYPLWGTMYLRLWLVDQIIMLCGKGLFQKGNLLLTYYRLLGAKIGSNVKISNKAIIKHFDLITIHDNCSIDDCTMVPFGLEANNFVMLPISIGTGCVVCIKSIIIPGSSLPPYSSIGPLSTSNDQSSSDKDYELHTKMCRMKYQAPSFLLQYFLGYPIILILKVIKRIPWYFILSWMVYDARSNGTYSKLNSVYQIMEWFTTPHRIGFFFFIRVVNYTLMPFVNLLLVILIKKLIIGKFQSSVSSSSISPLSSSSSSSSPSSSSSSQYGLPWSRFQYWLMNEILPTDSGFLGVSALVGTHYEIISIIFRLLGSKIGERVYWPGSGVNIVQYDLLEVGNDVVFGSRSAILTRTSHEECKPIIIEDGCMVADRCVLLPGTTMKRGSVLGSGSLAREDCTIPVGSVWIGSRDGMAEELQPEDMSYVNKDLISPFGKAFYQHQSTYYVIPLWGIVGYNWLWSALCICYKSAPLILSLLIVIYMHLYQYFGGTSAPNLFITLFIVFLVLKFMFDIMALLIIIAMKWILIGRRKVGEYGWDVSSYCQRWQILLTVERISDGLKNLLQGSYYIVLYFRLLGSKIGTNVCLYPMGADPMMTEPELVTIGDHSSIDNASLVGHINTRGKFALNAVNIGKQCTLKSSSRLLSGATMEDNSIMLEHTLIMAGDILEKNTVKEGWPACKEYSMQQYIKQTDFILEKHV